MTDTPDHPRIWVRYDSICGVSWHAYNDGLGSTEYIRADLVPDVAANDAEITKLKAEVSHLKESLLQAGMIVYSGALWKFLHAEGEISP